MLLYKTGPKFLRAPETAWTFNSLLRAILRCDLCGHREKPSLSVQDVAGRSEEAHREGEEEAEGGQWHLG